MGSHRFGFGGGEAGDGARSIWKALQEAVSIPGRSLGDELAGGENKLVTWVVDDEPPVPPPPPPPGPTPPTEVVLRDAGDVSKLQREFAKALGEHGKQIHVHWWVE